MNITGQIVVSYETGKSKVTVTKSLSGKGYIVNDGTMHLGNFDGIGEATECALKLFRARLEEQDNESEVI